MLSAILKRFGYVRSADTVSLDDYMRLRIAAQELLDESRNFRNRVLDALSDTPAWPVLPAHPENVVSLKEWKEQNR